MVTIDLKCCEPQIVRNKFYLLLKVPCRLLHLSFKQLLLCFCANICLWAEPGGCKFRAFPGQENDLDLWLTLGPPNLWDCRSPTALSFHDHILSTSLSLLCVRASYFASVVSCTLWGSCCEPNQPLTPSLCPVQAFCHEGGTTSMGSSSGDAKPELHLLPWQAGTEHRPP